MYFLNPYSLAFFLKWQPFILYCSWILCFRNWERAGWGRLVCVAWWLEPQLGRLEARGRLDGTHVPGGRCWLSSETSAGALRVSARNYLGPLVGWWLSCESKCSQSTGRNAWHFYYLTSEATQSHFYCSLSRRQSQRSSRAHGEGTETQHSNRKMTRSRCKKNMRGERYYYGHCIQPAKVLLLWIWFLTLPCL